MSNKPFAIQGSDLTLGGVNLQAGTTGVVIPGVTQAVDYFVEEVERLITIGGNNPDIFGSDEGAVTVIDNSRYLVLTGTTPGQGYVPAEYSVDELDDGRIEEITVEVDGTFAAADKTRAEAGNMWATTTPTPFVSFNANNWTQIPFRPKMRAGTVENVGGGGADLGDLVIYDGAITTDGESSIYIAPNGEGYGYVTVPNDTSAVAGAATVIGNSRNGGGGVQIAAYNNTWTFGPDGDLTFPDGSIQTTAYTGQSGGGAIGTFFVIANDSGQVSKSTDGVTWTAGVDTGDSISRVATDGVTVAMIQSDQLSWTTFAGLEASTYVSGSSSISDKIGDRTINWRQIDYAGGYFVAVGRYTPTGSTLSQGVYGYSTDGRVWAFLTVDQTVVEYFGNNPVDSDWEFSDIDYNGVGWMFSVGDNEGTGTPQGGGVYITDLTATITSARCFSTSITYDASWNGSAWYMEGDNSLAGVNLSIDPRNGTFDGPIDPWATDIQDLGISAGSTNELAGGNGYIAASDSDGHVAWSDDNGQTWQIVTPIPYTRTISSITQASPAVVSFSGSGETGGTGEKVIISGSSVAGYNGTFYWEPMTSSLYTDQARTTPFDTSGLEPFTGTATLTWSHGMYIDAMDYINGYFYIGNDNEQIARTVDFTSWNIVDDQTNDFEFWNDIAGFVNTGGDIGDIVVTVDEEATKLSLANKDFTLETTRTGDQDADINIYAADDIFIEANGDDLALSAKDQVRIHTGDSNGDPEDYKTWRFNSDGRIQFPDDTFQITAYPSSDVWVQEFKTSLGSQVDAPVMASSVEYLAGGDIVALFIHSENILGDSYSGVARINSAGERVWSMRFTGAPSTNGWGLAVDNNGGYIYVAGTASGLSDGLGGTLTYDVATLTKLSQTDGDVVWSQAYNVGVSNINTVVDVADDGSPVVVGFVSSGTNDQVVTSKINAVDGSVTWSRSIDGQGNEQAYGMAVGTTGEIVTVGWMTQLGATDAVATLYTDPVSNPNWVTTTTVTGGSGATYTVSFTGGVPTFTNINDPVGNRTVDGILDTIQGASFGGVTGVDDMIVKVGTLVANEPDDRMLIVKYNSTGAIQWQKAVQVLANYNCKGADADIDSEGNIYVCGNYDIGGEQAMIIIKFNSQGVKQWTRQLTGNCADFATSIVVGPDNFLYLSAVTVNQINDNVNMVIAKYDTDGSVEWQRLLSNTTNAVFAGEFFLNSEGGSNLAVKDGYVAVGGGFGDIANFPYSLPNAIVAQVGSHGAEFLAGNFEFEVAGFSGNLDDTASNITVVNAGKTDSDYAEEFTVTDFDPIVDLTSDLIGTLYHGSGGENRLFNSGRSLVLETTGAVTLPKGGTITEGVVTSNPTIQLTPARPDAASQKLVIKGGAGPGLYSVNNNIELSWSDNIALVGDTLTFNIIDSTTYANQTLYWWIYPTDVGIGDSNFGTVAIDNNGDGAFSILIDSDDYEFTVRVSPENNNYDPDNLGVESYLINASAPTYEDYHLHLTTGDLTETSIFLGTDDHNVRTVTDGTIQVTTTYYGAVDSVAFINSSGGYITGTYTGLGTTGGTGEGLTVDATSTGGTIDVITVVNPGKGYTDDDVITLVGGDGSGCTFVINVPTGTSEWKFNASGTVTFPTLTVPLEDNANPVGTGQVLQFSDSTQQAIIFGPVSTATNTNAQRVIIQGAPGYTGTTGEGGDVYVWAGPGGSANGQGGDIKVRAGQGIGSGNGGYLNFQAGDSATGNGGWINIESGSSNTQGQGGDITIDARRGGEITLRTNNGTTNLNWTFGADGNLTLPKASKISEVIPGTGAAANVIVIQSASSILNTSFATLPPAPISNYAVPGTDIVVNVTWSTNGEDYHSPRFEVVNGGTGHTGGGQFSGGEVLTVPYVDMGISGGGDWTWYVSDLASDVVLAAGLNEWTFGGDGTLTFPDATVQTTALVQGEHVFTLDTGAIDYAPTVVDFNLLFVTPAIGYSGTDPTSVTLPAGVPGQRLVIFNGSSVATLTVNPGPLGRDISGGVVAEFIYSGFDGVWIPLYGTNSPT